MNTARVSLSLAIMLSWTLSSPALAQQILPPGQAMVEDSAAEDGVDDLNTRSIFDNSNYMIRGDAGDSVGYIRGFQTLAAFQPIIINPDELILWMSPRGYVTYNSGDFAGNLGAGIRWLEPTSQRILGAGFWWDHDNNGSNQYDQLGGSAEWLGNMFDLRVNTYFPTNQNVHLVGQTFTPSSAPFFVGNNIAVGQNTFILNNALKGGDFEGGGALPGIGDLGIRAYAGGYYYEGPLSGGGVYGVRGRLEALITQNLWGTVIVTHDRLFGTNVSAAGTIYIGSGQAPKFFGRIPMTTRLYQQMERQYRVAVQRDVENDMALALRAGGTGGSGGPIGTPIVVDHVDNTAPAGGNGTVEHPLNTLPTTTPGNVDIIFVRRGDGTSTGMNQGITLNNFQRLLGDGVTHQFTSLQGTFTLPGFTAGALPTITNINADGTAVRIASNNEVSGFNITNPGGFGISNSGFANDLSTQPISNFNINNVVVTGAGNTPGANPSGDGLHLENATGTGLIASSQFNNNTANGVFINNANPPSTAALALNVGGTTANNVTANGNGQAGIFLGSSGAEIDPTFNNVTASNNKADGIQISLTAGATMTGVFKNVTASNNDNPFVSAVIGSGFDYQSIASTGSITMTQSTFNSNGLSGLLINLSAASTFTGSFDQVTANSNNNPVNFASAGPPGFFGNGFDYRSDASTGTVTITRSTFDTNGLNGINFATANGSTLTAMLINNNTTINANLQDGIGFQNTDSSVIATLLNNVIRNNVGMGVNIVSTATGAGATDFQLVAGGFLTQDTNGNGTLDPGEDSIVIPSLNFPPTSPEVIVGNGVLDREGNTITGNHGAGISFLLQDNSGGLGTSTGRATIIGNIIQNTGVATPASATYVGQGIDIRLTGNYAAANPTLNFGVIDDNTIGSLTNAAAGNVGSGIVVFADKNSNINSLQIGNPTLGTPHTGNSIGHNGGDGVSITYQDTAQIGNPIPVLIGNNQIDTNTGNGISITANNTAALASTFDVQNNDISNNTLNGILLTNDSSATPLINPTQTVNLNVTSSTFLSNGQMGIQVQDTRSFTNLTVGDLANASLGNTFTNNHGAGIFYQTVGSPNPTTTAASVNIGNNTITGTLVGTTPVQPGYGIGFILNSTTGTTRLVDIQIGGPGGSNTITGNASDGIHIEALDNVTLPTLAINNNTIGTLASGNGGSGINVIASNNSSIPSGTISNNAVINNTANGVIFTNSINTTGTWNLSGNQFNNNHADGMNASTSGNAIFNLTSTNDKFNSNTNDGIELTASDSTVMTIKLTGATVNGNGNMGIQMTTNGAATMNFNMDPCFVNNNVVDGINITTNDTSLMTVSISATPTTLNTIVGNGTGGAGGNGINVTTNSSGNFTISVTDTNISGNSLDGYLANHFGGGVVSATFMDDKITNNTQKGIEVEFHSPGVFSTTQSMYVIGDATGVTTNTISNNKAGGVYLTVDGAASNKTVTRSELVYNTGVYAPVPQDFSVVNTVLFEAFHNSFVSNTLPSAPADNILVSVGTGALAFADVERNTFSGNLTDFATQSFVSAQTPADVVVARSGDSATNPGTKEQRTITEDTLAQLNVRFLNNNGTMIAPTGGNAFGYNADSVKSGTSATITIAAANPFGPHTATPDAFNPRQSALFNVEDSTPVSTINATDIFTHNSLAFPPLPLGAFTNGGYNVQPLGTYTPPMTATIPIP